MKRCRVLALVVGLLLPALLASACAAPRPTRAVDNPDPSGKIPAIKDAVEANDLAAARQLIRDLESDDPAVRFYAIQGLQRLTGETFGYRYFDDGRDREAALEKWQAWLRGWEAGVGASERG
jgi:hypothetical protein